MKKEDIKILIVEDEEDQRIRLSSVLENEGFKIIETKSGEKAIKMMKSTDEYYNIVITDLKMPGEYDGEDILREIKNISPNTEVLIVTAYGSVDSAVRSIINGAFDYIQKPINIVELQVKIERALKSQEMLGQMNMVKELKNNLESQSRKTDNHKKKLSMIHQQSEKLLGNLKKDSPEYDIILEINKMSKIRGSIRKCTKRS